MLSSGLVKWGMQRMPVEDHRSKVIAKGSFKKERPPCFRFGSSWEEEKDWSGVTDPFWCI